MKKNNLKFYIIFLVTVALGTVLDQVTKVVTTGKSINVIGNFLRISYTQNTGVAFSFLSGKGWIFIPISIICAIALVLIFIFKKQKSTLFTLAISFVVCGAVGNLIDRIALSYVRDFIYFNFFPAIFNVADAFVTVGAILLLIYLIFFFEKEGKNGKDI